MTQFPSSLISFSTKANGQIIDAGDVNSPQNEITAIETKVGIDGSAIVTSLDYIAKNSASNGGGHVQAANVGGTGQTSFNKGDLLVATSASVLAKFAVGADGFALLADSTQAAGIKWTGVATASNIQNQTFVYARGSIHSASVIAINLSTPVSVLNDGLGLAIKFPVTNTTSVLALSVNATGPSSLVARIKNTDGTNPIVGAIQASMIGKVVFDSVSSVFQLQNTYLPTYGASITTFLRNDATWATISSPYNTGFGSWGTATSDGSAVQATADSFLVLYGSATGGTDGTVFTDSSNPPTTVRALLNANSGNKWTANVPVKKNDYYKIVANSVTITAAYIISIT